MILAPSEPNRPGASNSAKQRPCINFAFAPGRTTAVASSASMPQRQTAPPTPLPSPRRRLVDPMEGTGVIDRFLEVFTRYIDSGFGLLSGEVAFIATTLIVIDVTPSGRASCRERVCQSV